MENYLFNLKANCKLANVPSGIAPAKIQRILVKRNTTFIDIAQQPASQLTLSRVSDNIENGEPHQSVKKLRKRAEAFAHFWYQFKHNENAIGGVLSGGNLDLLIYPDLKKNNIDEKIRFERPNKLTLNEPLNTFIEGEYTDNTELDWVLNKFLGYIKDNFMEEKNTNNY